MVSCWSPFAFHSWPEARIIAGIDASMITSLGTCRFVMPRSESTIDRSGPVSNVFSIAARIVSPSSCGQLVERGQDRAEPVVRARAERLERVVVLGEDAGEEGADGVPEDDRVRDLHHRRLQVQGEQHALLLARRRSAPAGRRRARGRASPRRRRSRPLGPGSTSLSTVAAPSAATYSIRSSSSLSSVTRALGRAEVAVAHRRDVGAVVLRPLAHRVRMRARVGLHRGGRPAIRVALAQDRVDRAALDPVVRLAGLLGVVRARIVRIVGNVVARPPAAP